MRRRVQGRCKRYTAAVPARRLLRCNAAAQRNAIDRASRELAGPGSPSARPPVCSAQCTPSRRIRPRMSSGITTPRHRPTRSNATFATGSCRSDQRIDTSAMTARPQPHARLVAQAARYAPHLAKCMGKGRTAARNASRRCRQLAPLPPAAANRSPAGSRPFRSARTELVARLPSPAGPEQRRAPVSSPHHMAALAAAHVAT
jgi:hypothetical protein